MRFSIVKIGTLVTFCFILFYAFFISFESWHFSLMGVALFLFCYAIALRFLKQRHGVKFRQFLNGWGEAVDPQVALATSPFIRGVVIFDGEKIFTRIGADNRGIYLYKQGCYSSVLQWDRVLIEKVGGTDGNVVRVTSKNRKQCQFFLSWSDAFNKWS